MKIRLSILSAGFNLTQTNGDNMGIYIDAVTVYCDAKCCDNKIDVRLAEGKLENFVSSYSDTAEELKNEIADVVFPWILDGKKEGYEDNTLCHQCQGNIDDLKADIKKLESKLSNYEGI